MPIQFPENPTNGQVSQGYYYDANLLAWKASPISAGPASIADSAPSGAIHGDVWYNSTDGTIYVYYVDGTSSQWVETRSMPAPYVASSSTARDAFFGVPADETARLNLQNSGVQCFRSDRGWTEQYLATYNASTNPGGMAVAGWYPKAPVSARFWIPDHTANPSGTFTMTLDSTKSSSLALNFFSISGSTITFRNPGVYSLWYRIRSTAVASGTRAFFTIQFSDLYTSNGSTFIDGGFRTSIENSGEDSDHISTTYNVTTPGSTATFMTYSSISASYTMGIAGITYLGPLG